MSAAPHRGCKSSINPCAFLDWRGPGNRGRDAGRLGDPSENFAPVRVSSSSPRGEHGRFVGSSREIVARTIADGTYRSFSRGAIGHEDRCHHRRFSGPTLRRRPPTRPRIDRPDNCRLFAATSTACLAELGRELMQPNRGWGKQSGSIIPVTRLRPFLAHNLGRSDAGLSSHALATGRLVVPSARTDVAETNRFGDLASRFTELPMRPFWNLRVTDFRESKEFCACSPRGHVAPRLQHHHDRAWAIFIRASRRSAKMRIKTRVADGEVSSEAVYGVCVPKRRIVIGACTALCNVHACRYPMLLRAPAPRFSRKYDPPLTL